MAKNKGAGWKEFAKVAMAKNKGAGWIDFAKKAASFAKPFIAQHGGEYGQQAANAMGSLGLGHRRGRGGAVMSSINFARNRGKGAGWIDFAKKAASFAKPFIAQHGGEYGQQAANAMGALGLGHKRRVARGAGWIDFAKKAASFAKPLIAQHGGEYGQQAANIMGTLGLGRRKHKGGASASARAMMGLGGKRAERAAIVKSIMQERGVTLPQASKIVKLEGLY